MMLPDPVPVTDRAGLRSCIATCRQSGAIAVDTEFVRTDTFYPQLGLIQLSDGDRVWLVDPLAMSDFADLADLLLDPDVVKVFHSCSEDLEVLRYCLGIVPQPLFDTQVAAAFLGHGFSLGYSALVGAVLDIQLDKHETRSDWLRRPLTEAQLRYAAEDVYFLMKVYDRLAASLRDAGRESWMAEEMAELVRQAEAPDTPETYYRRVKGTWKLTAGELGLLRELTTWRETEARRRDRPRNRVVADRVLLELVKLKPPTVNGLYSVDGLHKGIIRRYGDRLMEIMASSPDAEGLESPPEPLDRAGRALLSHCRQKLESRAEKDGVATQLLGRKKDLESLVASVQAGSGELPDRLASGWRYELIGRELLEYATDRAAGDD